MHWYKYPLTSWLSIITSAGACLQGGDMDIAYLSEIDPNPVVDSSLTTILNPRGHFVYEPDCSGACAADASLFNKPLDILWCAGSQGSGCTP